VLRTQCLWIAVAAKLFVALSAAADTVAIPSMKDTTLYESDTGALSDGHGQNFFSGATAFGLKRRGLIAFDIAASVPPGSTIRDVMLILHLSQTTAGPGMISLNRALADWGEGDSIAPPGHEGMGAPAAQGDATWLHTFYNTRFWSAPGGDFNGTPSAEAPVAGVDFYAWTSTAQLVSDVQSWLDSPQGNFGWVLIAEDESLTQTARRFDTRENQNPVFRPVLQVQFIPPVDGGLSDAGLPDGGSSDAGSADAGPMDAGQTDGGIDAGQPDSGMPDGGQPPAMSPQSSSGCQIGSRGSGFVFAALAVLLLVFVQARQRG
jgi:hypothetical protein